jgi:tetratricopeptide (TPR) repeat protein
VHETKPEAYALYLQARHLSRQYTAEGYAQAIPLYQQALAIDPGYAAAWSDMASTYGNQGGSGLLPPEEGFAKAREAANKALAIDPDYAPAHATLGWMALNYDNDLAQAARYYKRALALDPANLDIIRTSAAVLQSLGRLDEAIKVGQYVSVRDPVNPNAYNHLGSNYLYAGHWDEAQAAYQTAQRLSPGYIGSHYFIGSALLFKGQAEAALEAFTLEEGDEEFRVKGQALALYALGRQQEYQAKLDELITRWGAEWPSEVAQVYAYTGAADAAFEWLDKSVKQNETGLNQQFLQKLYQPVQADPRWMAFLERVGNSPEQLAAIEFNVTLP